jgi:hypothetical protein
MNTFPETLSFGQVVSRELKEEIERRYNTYVELEKQLAAKEAEIEMLKASVYGVYELERQLAVKDALYHEILMAVESKWPDKTRHQTALRYIRQAERGNGGAASATEKEFE